MKAFECPRCEHKIPKKRAFFLTHLSVITCTQCKERLVPESKKMTKIGAWYGALSGLGSAIITMAVLLERPILGIALTLALAVTIYMMMVNKTYQSVRFKPKK